MSREHVDAVHRNVDAWHRGDLSAWLDTAHPESEWVSEVARRMAGSDGVYRGHGGLRRYWGDVHSVGDVKVQLDEVRGLGDTILAIGRTRALGEGSGIDLDGPIALVYEFEEG